MHNALSNNSTSMDILYKQNTINILHVKVIINNTTRNTCIYRILQTICIQTNIYYFNTACIITLKSNTFLQEIQTFVNL